jgi:uncharacterized repeat protein (TIGR01451 family)
MLSITRYAFVLCLLPLASQYAWAQDDFDAMEQDAMHEGIPYGRPEDFGHPGMKLPDRAHLVARKRVKETTVVAGENVTVTIDVFNTGATAAYSVRVEDTTFPASLYERVEGESKAQWAKLGAGANESMTFVVKPKAAGVLTAGPALVTYRMGSEATEALVQLWSVPLLPAQILSPVEKYVSMALEFGKYTSLGFLKSKSDWQVFGVIFFVIAGLLFINSSIKRYRVWRRTSLSEKYYEELSKSQ